MTTDIQSAHAAKLKRFSDDMDVVCSTTQGVRFMSRLATICGFVAPSARMGTSDPHINSIDTVYNEGRRSVYLDFRKHISREHLIKIELGEDPIK